MICIKSAAGVLSLSLLFSSVAPSFAQANLWQERKEALRQAQGGEQSRTGAKRLTGFRNDYEESEHPAKVPLPDQGNIILAQLPSIDLHALSNFKPTGNIQSPDPDLLNSSV